jgi:WD40 repeat protein
VQTWNVAFNPGQPNLDFGKPLLTFSHGAAANDVVVAADNATLYTASADKSIKVWKAASDAPTKSFAHPNLVDAVAFNKEGTQLLTGCHDGKLRVWDIAKAMVLKEIAAHVVAQPPSASPIYCVAWSPDGKNVLSGSADHSLKLFDATSGNLVKEFKGYNEKDFDKGHRDGIFCAAFSPDGTKLASGSSTDKAIKIWNVADGTVALELANPNLKPSAVPLPPQAHPGWVYGLRYTKDGKYLISVGGAPKGSGYLAVWNIADGKLLSGEALPLGTFFALAIAPDGQSLAVGTGAIRTGTDEANKSFVLKMPAVVK